MEVSQLEGLVKVAVGSKNPVKVRAARRVLTKIYGKGKVEVKGFKVSSGVPRQPLGWQTVRGAINRALEALKIGGAELGIGIEAGLFPVKKTITGYMDFQWCAVADRGGFITLGCGPGFEMPPSVVKGVLDGRGEVGELLGEMFRVERLGETIGAIGLLSHGIMDRVKLTEQAVLMAMIPRINREIYLA